MWTYESVKWFKLGDVWINSSYIVSIDEVACLVTMSNGETYRTDKKGLDFLFKGLFGKEYERGPEKGPIPV